MSSKRPPNILHIFTDQQRFDTIGALGNPWIRTPNLDRLCREGTAFTSAYTPSPACVPARCSMITGLYPNQTGCTENGQGQPIDPESTLMGRLRAAGYRTHGIGKCHFEPELLAPMGFDEREISEELDITGEDDHYFRFLRENGGEHILDPHGVRSEMYYVPQVAQMPARLHPTQWVGDRSVAFLKSHADDQQPWYLYAGIIHPHPPFAPPSPWHRLYRGPMMPPPHEPADFESLLCHINRFQNRYKYRDQGWDLNLVRQIRAYYYACISFLDFQIGRMLDQLEANGQSENTLIVFSSDHGELLGDFRSFGKRSMHDAAARIPLLARWPGHLAAGETCDSPVSLIDLLPTFCAAAGAPVSDEAAPGCDLLAVARGEVDRPFVFSQHGRAGHGLYGFIERDWKYVYSAPDQREYLFDRRQTPELRDHAGIPWTQPVLKRMRAQAREFFAGFPDGLQPFDGDRWTNHPLLSMPSNPDSGVICQEQSWAKWDLPGYGKSH